jgi:hypothetical protein
VSGRPRLRTFAWPASAALALALLVPAAAVAQERTVETATNGTVTAELSYVKRMRGRGRFEFEEFRDFRVKITRAGQVLYDQPVGDPCEQFCTPTETALTRKHVALRDLNADGEPEAIIGLFTGGRAAVSWSSRTATTHPRTSTGAPSSTPAAATSRAISAPTA